MPLVLLSRDDGVATVTLNRPEAMNALSRALRSELAATMRALAADVEARRTAVMQRGRERGDLAG